MLVPRTKKNDVVCTRTETMMNVQAGPGEFKVKIGTTGSLYLNN